MLRLCKAPTEELGIIISKKRNQNKNTSGFEIAHIDPDGLSAWLLMLLIADIWMGVGAKTGKRVLLLPWLVLYMIYLLVSFVAAPLLLYSATYAIREARQRL